MDNNVMSLTLFRYQELVEGYRQIAVKKWDVIPPEAMLFFGAEVLASGVVLSAIARGSGLDKMRWPGDLVVILGLGIPGKDQVVRVGHALTEISDSLGMDVNQTLQMNNIFLEALQWLVVEELSNKVGSGVQKQISVILGDWKKVDEKGRYEVLKLLDDLLVANGIDTFTAKDFFERALNKALEGALAVFSDKLPAPSRTRIEKMIR
jgi:hypothetical protein